MPVRHRHAHPLAESEDATEPFAGGDWVAIAEMRIDGRPATHDVVGHEIILQTFMDESVIIGSWAP